MCQIVSVIFILLYLIKYIFADFETDKFSLGLKEKYLSSADEYVPAVAAEAFSKFDEVHSSRKHGNKGTADIGNTMRRRSVKIRKKKAAKNKAKMWDHWGKWSTCSATCGVGKSMRWRHCIAGGCATGEKEAQIKSCTLPAC